MTMPHLGLVNIWEVYIIIRGKWGWPQLCIRCLFITGHLCITERVWSEWCGMMLGWNRPCSCAAVVSKKVLKHMFREIRIGDLCHEYCQLWRNQLNYEKVQASLSDHLLLSFILNFLAQYLAFFGSWHLQCELKGAVSWEMHLAQQPTCLPWHFFCGEHVPPAPLRHIDPPGTPSLAHPSIHSSMKPLRRSPPWHSPAGSRQAHLASP